MPNDGVDDDEGQFERERERDHGPCPRSRSPVPRELADQPRPGDAVDHRGDRELQRLRPDRGAHQLSLVNEQPDEGRQRLYRADDRDREQRLMPLRSDGLPHIFGT